MPNLIHWVEEVFRWVLQTTWQTTVLVGLILLAQWLLRRRLAPRELYNPEKTARLWNYDHRPHEELWKQ